MREKVRTHLTVESTYNFTPLHSLRQFFTEPMWLFPLQGFYNSNKYEGTLTLTAGYYYPKIGEQKEEFGFTKQVNNFHMIGSTKLEVPDVQLELICNMLYKEHPMVL